MSPKYAYTKRLKAVFLALMTMLLLAGCMSEDDKRVSVDKNKVGSGEMFHGAEWATIKNLDPRKEECADCHGKNNDMSPYNSGVMAHNIGLQKNTDHSAYADLEITSVKIDDTTGEVTVTLSDNLPANAGALSMTFAKLAPRVVHNRGHDWQNYFSSNATGRGGNEPKASFMPNGGVQPIAVPNPKINGKTITFNLNEGTGRSFDEHNFQVKSAYETDTTVWDYQGIKGTKMIMGADLSTHVYCDAAHASSNQTEDSTGAKPVCWWPDGTHLTAGTFVTTDNEFVVEYNPDQTHRVTVILGSSPGNPGFNIWYDFVPSVASGDKTPADFSAAGTTLTGDDYIEPITGKVIALNYEVSEGNRAPGGTANNDTQGHQSLPAARDVVDVQSCNSCHDALTMHGSSGRSQTQTCVTCHNPGNLQASSGRSVDFKVLIHRIHRGANLPSEDSSLATLMANGNKLVVDTASDFTKVRFPQGPTPGQAAGITNCVKCHMGEQTQDMVQGLAAQLGPGEKDLFNVQEKLKLAKVTPQGDNWLAVRSVNACQACHDSNVWFSGGGNFNAYNEIRNAAAGATKNPNDPAHQLDKYMAFYSSKYSDVGFDWIGKKLTRTNQQGWVHNTEVAGHNGRFTCGSGGGCHGNNAIDTLNTMNVGDRNTNAIQQVHLELTRNYILAERFEIQVDNPRIDGTVFKADVRVFDKKTNSNLFVTSDLKTTPDTTLGELTLNVGGNLGWMHDSPDYNHSPGGGIPGSPLGVTVTWDGSDTGKASADLSLMSRPEEWDKIKNDFSNIIGSVYIEARAGDYNFKTAVSDFRFDGKALASNEGRRKVVDFAKGQGVDESRGRYASWDKEHGANTQSCSSCHLQLAYHGGGRRTNNVQACIVCHNPQRTDVNTGTRRGVLSDKDGQYEESLDFKRLIHAIHSAPNKRIDPMYVGTANSRPSMEGDAVRGHSFPGVLSNCKSCHIEDENTGKWTFELDQLPEGMIGSTAITADWSLLDSAVAGTANYDPEGKRHNFANHLKMSPIASVCSSCHDAGYKTTEGRMNADILDGGPYVGSHWWQMGGIAPGIVRPGESPQSTKHQSGK